MIKTRSIILALSAAIAVAALGFSISVKRYEPLYESRQNQDASSIKIFPEDPVLGNKEANITIIAFEDMGRGRCLEQMRIFYQLLDEYPNQIKIIWKSLDATQFPFSSKIAHSYAYCANQQNKFMEFEKIILEQENIDENSLKNYAVIAELDRNILSACLLSEKIADYKEKNMRLAAELGIQKIPSAFIGDKIINKPLTFEGWREILSLQ